jgi:DNA-binding response OmpR family regulator
MAKILLLDDDKCINNLVKNYLVKRGHNVVATFDGLEAISNFDKSIDLAVLDIIVPKIDGYGVLEEIRKLSVIPVIFLTSKSDDINMLDSYSKGVDCFVPKPFCMGELYSRIEAILRRCYTYKCGAKQIEIKYKNIYVDLIKSEVFINGELLDFRLKEYGILVYLIKNKGTVVTKKEIYTNVWNSEYKKEHANLVMVHITNLRKLIDNNKNNYITSIKCVGYRLNQ